MVVTYMTYTLAYSEEKWKYVDEEAYQGLEDDVYCYVCKIGQYWEARSILDSYLDMVTG